MASGLADAVHANTLALWFGSYSLGIIAFAHHTPALVVACCAAALAAACSALVPGLPVVRRTSWLCGLFAVAGALAAQAADWRDRRDRLDAFDGRHLTCMVEALERPRSSSAGASMRVRIDAVEGNAELDTHLRGRVALLEMPVDAGSARVAGERL